MHTLEVKGTTMAGWLGDRALSWERRFASHPQPGPVSLLAEGVLEVGWISSSLNLGSSLHHLVAQCGFNVSLPFHAQEGGVAEP